MLELVGSPTARDASGERRRPDGARTRTGSVSPTSTRSSTRPTATTTPNAAPGAEAERQALLDELGRVTGAHRQPRQFANHPAERARKAVTARIRDAIRKLEPVLPELAAHLERTIVTGTYCRYRPDGTAWEISAQTGPARPVRSSSP